MTDYFDPHPFDDLADFENQPMEHQAVSWLMLLRDARDLHRVTGRKMENLWRLILTTNYEAARAYLTGGAEVQAGKTLRGKKTDD